MRRPRAPLFLARTPYRRRRLRDAARLLPVLALFLMTLPVLWSPPGQAFRITAADVLYFFAIWLALILLAAGIAPGLSDEDAPSDEGDD